MTVGVLDSKLYLSVASFEKDIVSKVGAKKITFSKSLDVLGSTVSKETIKDKEFAIGFDVV